MGLSPGGPCRQALWQPVWDYLSFGSNGDYTLAHATVLLVLNMSKKIDRMGPITALKRLESNHGTSERRKGAILPQILRQNRGTGDMEPQLRD